MAKRQTTQRARAQNTGTSSWVMLLVGVVIGLSIAFLIYIAYHDDTGKAPKEDKPAQAKKTTQSALPQFDFYSILPELEVFIPEQFTAGLRKALPQNREETKTTQTQTSNQQPPEKTTNTYFIQAGSFKSPQDAERMKVNLLLLGMDVYIKVVNVEGVQYHRVRIGPLKDYTSFEQARNRLKENNIQYMVLETR